MSYIITKLGTVDLIERKEQLERTREDDGYQPLLEREVVVKRLTAEAAADPRLRGGFIREARMLAGLHHHNLLQVYEAGLQDDIPYMVLEKLEGITVQQLLNQLADQRTRMDMETIIQIVQEVASAVEHVHQSAILVHHLSPDNIMLTSTGRKVLMTLEQRLPENLLTASPMMLNYASPERLLSGLVDKTSDVYALGVLLYHLMFGRLPFEGSAISILEQKQHAASLPALDDTRTELPCSYALAHVLRQATSRSIQQRYSSITAFREALTQVFTSGPVKLQLQRRPTYRMYQEMQLRKRRNTTQRAMPLPVVAAPPAAPVPGLRDLVPETPPAPAYAPARSLMVEIEESLEQLTHGSDTAQAVVPVEAATRPAPVAALLTDIDLDPLMPGKDMPDLWPALPFTTLVPMPTEPAAQPAHSVSAAAPARRNYIWLVGMLLLALIAMSVATRLG